MDVGDYVQNVVGLCGAKLSRDFYALPDASALVLSVFRNADSVPDYRLRYWLKRGWSRLVSSCPAEQAAVVTPVVCALTRHMQELLTSRWAAVENLDDGRWTPTSLNAAFSRGRDRGGTALPADGRHPVPRVRRHAPSVCVRPRTDGQR